MNVENPYNCTQPGNRFTGYKDELKQITSGCLTNRSYVILGGRRCGKTSLLMQIADRVNQQGVCNFQAFARRIDLAAQVPHSVYEFFAAIYRAVVDGTAAEPWETAPAQQPYQEFLRRLQTAAPHIEARHGKDWLAVLLIDKLDLAQAAGDEVFQNLRNLLQDLPFRTRFRLVATGGSAMYRLVSEGSPLVGILERVCLRALTEEEADELMAAGPVLSQELRRQIYELSGGHAFILQGLMEQLFDASPVDSAALRGAVRRFERNHGVVFQHWICVWEPERVAIYRAIAEGRATRFADEPLLVLSFHGVIDDQMDAEKPRINGTLFRDWFLRNAEVAAAQTGPPAAPAANTRKNVFVVYGRDVRRRGAMFNFLRSLGLNPLEWGDLVEMTGPAPYVGEILQKGFEMASAAVVLLTGDDEVRLQERFRGANDEPYEAELTPQARPNVLFEAGMAMALFPKKTVIVQVGRIRPMTDILGRHVLRMTDDYPQRLDLAKRLRAAGCDIVDIETTSAWQTAGTFDDATKAARS